MDKKGCPLTKSLKNSADIALSFYFLLDHVLLLDKIKAYKFSQGTVSIVEYVSNFFWMIETLSTLTYQILEIYALNEEIIIGKIELKRIDSQTEGKIN